MKNTLTYQKLENIFASDFTSPSFIILANKYYNDRHYKKAERVCQIGLKHNPNNNIAKYILAKVYLIKNDLVKAEKLLKEVIKRDPNNFNAFLVIIDVSKMLKRSSSTINKYIATAHSVLPDNQSISKMFNQIKDIKSNQKKKKKKTSHFQLEPTMEINTTMATKTMYNLMIKQQKYDLAKHILNVMIQNKKFVSFAKKELKKIQNK